jgi:hypothetical protein
MMGRSEGALMSSEATVEVESRVRQHPRYEVHAQVEVLPAERESEGIDEVPVPDGSHRIQNMSLGGICIQTGAFEEVGTVVDLVINFPDLRDHQGGAPRMAVRGQIVWANREPPIELGIRYIDLDETRKLTLRQYMGALSASPPARTA